MASKRFMVFFLLLCFFVLFSLHGQDAGYFMETRFVQRLTWSGDDYAMRYEVIIEKETDTGYTIAAQEYTSAFFIELSLSPGKYRYRVIPYDFLGSPGSGTQWIEFDVLPALVPELYGSVPEFDYSFIPGRFILTITGKNLENNAVFYLSAGGMEFHPIETNVYHDGSGAVLVFDRPHLIPENYIIFARNPSSLEANIAGSFYIIPPPVNYFKLYLSASWLPLLGTYGDMNWLSEQNSFLGVMARFGFVFTGLKLIDLGLETGVSGLYNNNLSPFISADLNLLTQIQTPARNMAIRFRLGAGYGFYGSMEWQSFHVNVGASFLWFVWKQLYIETGFDSIYWSIDEDNSGALRPWIGVGWSI